MLRYEYKYYVPESKIDLLRSMIQPFMELDAFAASQSDKQYTVRSIYFDTPDFECYNTKIDGLKHRNKVRLRGYNKEDPKNKVFLEIKRKYEGPIMKNRAFLKFEDVKEIFKGASPDAYVQDARLKQDEVENVKRFFYHLHSRKMRPVVGVIYEREPYLSKVNNRLNNLRITFDKNLRGISFPTIDNLYSEEDVRYARNGFFILEVKFNNRYPAWMTPIISTLQLTKESASKYCICVDLHNIGTDSNYQFLKKHRF